MLLYQILAPNIYEKYSVSDIHDYFECVIKKHETMTDNPPVRISVNTIENMVKFRIETGYYL